MKSLLSIYWDKFKFPIRFSGYIGSPISTSSDYQTINENGGFSDGSLLSFEVLVDKLYKGFGLKFDYETISVTSVGDKNLEATSSAIGAYIVYLF